MDRCIAGDVVDVVGVIKTYQSSHTFSKHTETALHSLYVHVNSISKIKNDDDIYSKNDNEDEMIVSGKRGRDEDGNKSIRNFILIHPIIHPHIHTYILMHTHTFIHTHTLTNTRTYGSFRNRRYRFT